MPTKLEKEKRKALRKGYKDREKQGFLSNLPIPMKILEELFDWLDKQAEIHDCNDTLKQTKVFINHNNLPENELVEWLESHGGYCDCEVLANVEQDFEESK